MADRLWFLIPELILLGGAVVCVIAGLSNHAALRRRVGFICCAFLAVACISVPFVYTPERVQHSDVLFPQLGLYIKFCVCAVSIPSCDECWGIDR